LCLDPGCSVVKPALSEPGRLQGRDGCSGRGWEPTAHERPMRWHGEGHVGQFCGAIPGPAPGQRRRCPTVLADIDSRRRCVDGIIPGRHTPWHHRLQTVLGAPLLSAMAPPAEVGDSRGAMRQRPASPRRDPQHPGLGRVQHHHIILERAVTVTREGRAVHRWCLVALRAARPTRPAEWPAGHSAQHEDGYQRWPSQSSPRCGAGMCKLL